MSRKTIGDAMLYLGDSREVLKAFVEEASVDSIVCDPPYELGFMGKGWDRTGIANDAGLWREALRVLKPGGHLLAFGGTRTYHRMACAIEDAGFEVRDQIGWVYGSGFPKSLDLAKAIDKAAGVERDVIGRKAERGGVVSSGSGQFRDDGGRPDKERLLAITAAATDAAKQWEGWGTALKPAWEPICVARKPLAGTVAANVTRYRTGGLNIDGCRVKHDEECRLMAPSVANIDSPSDKCRQAGRRSEVLELKPAGRWPANIIHDGSEEVLALFPQVGPGSAAPRNNGEFKSVAKGIERPNITFGHEDNAGSAARFFYCAKAAEDDRHDGKHAMPGGKNHHPTVKPTDLMRYLVRLVTPRGGLVLDPFAGSGSTGMAALLEGMRFAGVELDPDYFAIASARIDSAWRQGYQPGLLEQA